MRIIAGCLCLLLLQAGAGCRSGRGEPAAAVAGDDSLVASAAISGESQPADSAAVGLPILDLGYNAREGRVLYRHYCSTCHGAEGHGDGFNAYNLDPKPRDLADSTFQAQRTDEDLASIIRSGGGVAGLSTGMPPWGRTLRGRQIDNIVAYLRTLHESME